MLLNWIGKDLEAYPGLIRVDVGGEGEGQLRGGAPDLLLRCVQGRAGKASRKWEGISATSATKDLLTTHGIHPPW